MTDDRDIWLGVRELLLGFVDLIERKLGISPRTSELRKERKRAERLVNIMK